MGVHVKKVAVVEEITDMSVHLLTVNRLDSDAFITLCSSTSCTWTRFTSQTFHVSPSLFCWSHSPSSTLPCYVHVMCVFGSTYDKNNSGSILLIAFLDHKFYHVSVSLNPCLSLSIYIPPSNSSLEKLLWLFVVLAFGLLMSFIINQHNNYTYLWAGHWQFLTVYLLFLYNSSRVILLAHSYILWPPDPA